MALESYEVLSVVGKTFLDLSEKLKDGKIDKSEVVDVVKNTVMDLLAEYTDDD